MLQAELVETDCMDQQARGSQATQRAGSCVPYFQKMRKMFCENAAVCLKETRLLQSLVDMAGSNQTARSVNSGGARSVMWVPP